MNNILVFCIVYIERRSVLLLLIGLIICRINTIPIPSFSLYNIHHGIIRIRAKLVIGARGFILSNNLIMRMIINEYLNSAAL